MTKRMWYMKDSLVIMGFPELKQCISLYMQKACEKYLQYYYL